MNKTGTSDAINVMWEQNPAINKNLLNLCEILTGYQGELFYCTLTSDMVKLIKLTKDHVVIAPVNLTENTDIPALIYLNKFGELYNNGECVIYPTKLLRDWVSWRIVNPNKSMTVSNIIRNDRKEDKDFINYIKEMKPKFSTQVYLQKSYAYTAITYLISKSYTDYNSSSSAIFYIIWSIDDKCPKIKYAKNLRFISSPIIFNSYEAADQFISYNENVELLKLFFC